MLKIVTIVGARPQFIKAATVSRAISRHNDSTNSSNSITEILVHTGQHYDQNMSKIFFDELKIAQPQYNLNIGSDTHGRQTAKMLSAIEEVLEKERPDWVLVYGDTNSTVAGALAAAKLHIPVAHVEAGLRSFNRRMPEEINRVLTDHMSNLLFCPTDTAVKNLNKEGITQGVLNVGDVMYDAFLSYKELAQNKILSKLSLEPKNYCLATVHRQENTDIPDRLLSIFTAFDKIAQANCPIILPIHPRTQKALEHNKNAVPANPHVRLIQPVSHFDMIALEMNARIILTDSGGMQKEAFFAKVPCVTIRDESEWIETIEAGWNYLAGTETELIVNAFNSAQNINSKNQPELYGDGKASQLILNNFILTKTTE